jgi:hypothetical protein
MTVTVISRDVAPLRRDQWRVASFREILTADVTIPGIRNKSGSYCKRLLWLFSQIERWPQPAGRGREDSHTGAKGAGVISHTSPQTEPSCHAMYHHDSHRDSFVWLREQQLRQAWCESHSQRFRRRALQAHRCSSERTPVLAAGRRSGADSQSSHRSGCRYGPAQHFAKSVSLRRGLSMSGFLRPKLASISVVPAR